MFVYGYVWSITTQIDRFGLNRVPITFTASNGLTLDVTGYTNLSHLKNWELKNIVYKNAPEAPLYSSKSPNDAKGNLIILHHYRQQSEGPIVAMPEQHHDLWNIGQHPNGNKKGGECH